MNNLFSYCSHNDSQGMLLKENCEEFDLHSIYGDVTGGGHPDVPDHGTRVSADEVISIVF